jgi:acyl carrier protein
MTETSSAVGHSATTGNLKDRIRNIVKDNVRIGMAFSALEDSTPLYQAGMTSYASVQLMLALENEFSLEFPDVMLNREVFESIDSIANAIAIVLRAES